MRTFPRHPRMTFVMLGFALACSCASLSAQTRPERPQASGVNGSYKIAGIVVSGAGGGALARARVTIVDTRNPRNTQWMITAGDGLFEFNRLRAGKYTLQGARRGFIPTSYNQHQQFSTAIVTRAAYETENLILRLVPIAMVSGKILDESGEPVHNAVVKLYGEDHNFGVSRISLFATASSDDRGYYDFWPVMPGTYYVSAAARPWYAVHPPLARSAGEGKPIQAVDASLDVSYLPTFFEDTTEADAATPVSIKGGDHAQVDIHLWPAPSLHLLLHVPEDGQNGFSYPTLQRRVFDSVEPVEVEGAQPVSAGTYEIAGVPEGTYIVRLHGSAPGEADQTIEMDLTKDGQELDPSSGEVLGSLNLSVKILGEKELPQQLFVTLRDVHLRTVGFQVVDRNGEAHFDNIPAGKYAIVAGSPGKPYFVSQTSSSGTETKGNSFELSPGSSLSMSAVLIGGAARVEGFVERSGKAAAGVMVVLVPEDVESNIELFRRDQSDFDGSFNLPGVVPGSYTVIAIEDGWNVDWSAPAVLSRYTSRGQKLTITPQTQGSVKLPEPVEVQPR